VEISVILGNHDNPDCLERAVWGYFRQSHQDFELLIAGYGPAGEVAPSLARLRSDTRLTIRHVYDERPGTNRNAAVNLAIERASGSYLVFSCVHCIPRWDFLEAHARLARPGRFLSGSAFVLPSGASRLITTENVVSGRATDAGWLAAQGLRGRNGTRFRAWGPQWAQLLDLATGFNVEWNSGNASCWKADLLEVNGFDERIESATSDRELGERLRNCGVRGKQVQHRAVCVELATRRPYVGREAAQRGLDLCTQARRSRATWTPYGIRKGFRVFGPDDAAKEAERSQSRRAVA
jgi:hypothetical protein